MSASKLQPLAVGVIGAGGIAAKLHLPQLQEIPGLTIAKLAGRKMDRLKLLSKRHGGEPVTDFAAVVEDPKIDGVVVATPHPLHVAWGVKALAAGKHVFMQKPLASTIEDADRFVAACEKSDRVVYCLPQLNFPAVMAIRDLIAEGALGKVSGAHSRYSHGGPEIYYAEVCDLLGEEPLKPGEKLWFFEAGEAAVGALFDMGVYAIARLVAVLGSARRVMGMAAILDKPSQVEDTASLLIEFESGAIATAETGWCDGARTGLLTVHGSFGRAEQYGYRPTTAKLYQLASKTREDVPPTERDVDCGKYRFQNAHEQWVECIRNGTRPELETPQAARHITEIMLAGLKSAKSGQAVALKTRLK